MLIDDHQWLIDLEKVFDKEKYVMRIKPVDGDKHDNHTEEREN